MTRPTSYAWTTVSARDERFARLTALAIVVTTCLVAVVGPFVIA